MSKTKVIKRVDWASKDVLWHGKVEGMTLGTDVTVLFFATEQIGHGPRWHVHPYGEVFIMRTGRALQRRAPCGQGPNE